MIHIGLKNMNRAIAEANSIIKTNLHIVDGISTIVKAQERRHDGKPAYLGYMFAGKDPVALDSFGLSVINNVQTMDGKIKKWFEGFILRLYSS